MRGLLPSLALLAVGSLFLEANPTGGVVPQDGGSATIAGQGSPVVTVNQASNTVIINWQTFSIGSGELTKFIQPSSTSAALNRVLGGQTSFINGTLSANGQVYLINGNGIVVGPGGIITTAGFTASTRDIADADFMSGKLHFTGGNDAGVVNLGTIDALGGDVVLLGKTVDNKGTIDATGTAGLVAGDDVLLAQENADGSTITVNPVSAPSAPAGKRKVGVKNTGTITASTAELKAANGNIYALAIQNEGLVRATTITQQGGHIYLTADSGSIVNSGTLDASATAAKGHGGTILVKSTAGKVVHSGKLLARGGVGGTGGSADISGAQLVFTGTVDFTAPGGTTGDLLLDPGTLDVITGGGGSVTTPTGMPPSSQNNSTGSTIDPTVVDAALNSANLTLNADTNITVTNAISWDSANTLVISTNTGGSTVKINAPISDTYSGAGGVIFYLAAPTDAISTSEAGTINVANFILQRGAWTQLVNVGGNGGNIPQVLVNGTLTSVLPAFTATNDFEIDNGTFLRADSGNGTTVYYGLEDVYGLQGMKGFLNSNFTMNGYTIDGSTTSTWNSGSGFAPIGSTDAPYQGSFDDGTINNLTIDLPDSTNVGVIGVAGASAYLSNVYIENPSITGGTNVGGVVGENEGTLDFCYNFGGGNGVTGNDEVGGIVGLNAANATVQYGSNYGSVNGYVSVGGEVGENDGTVYSVQGYGTVTAATDSETDTDENIGGLVGLNISTGTINLSSFSGTVQASTAKAYHVGGIAGTNHGTIEASNTFPGASVAGDMDVGGVAGYNDGFIYDSYNSASVTGRADYEGGGINIGGIAGENTDTNVENTDVQSFASNDINQPVFNPNSGIIQTSYNTGTVEGVQAVGGIVGLNDANGTVTTCYNVGSIGDSDASYVGGIVGDNSGLVQYTYNSGPVSGQADTTAGLIGFDEDDAQAGDSYWDTVTSGQSIATNSNNGNENDEGTPAFEINLAPVSSSDGTAYTIAGNDPISGAGFGFFGAATAVLGTNGVYEITSSDGSPDGGGPSWYIIDGQTRPLLAMEANYNINNPHQLQLIALNLSGGYDITSYLDASVTNAVNNPAEVWTTAGFDPIGAEPNLNSDAGPITYAFNGNVYGNGETIQGLYINRPGTDNVGLFGYAGTGSNIEEVSLNDSSITGNNNVGGLVGTNLGALSYDYNNADDSPGAITGEGNNVGGIVGDNFGQITYSQNNSYGDATVVGLGSNIGGIAGVNEAGGVLGEDSNSGTVQAADGADNSDGIGGIVGSNNGTVTQSINTGNVGSGVEINVGGIAGNNNSQVDDSYSGGGTMSGTIDGAGNVGGLVGGNQPNSILETSYSTSTVMGGDESSTGAVVGANAGTVRHVYWDTDVSGEQSGIAENNDTEDTTDVAGYTTAQLTDIDNFEQGGGPALWDFSPQTGGGIWGVNVYNIYGQVNDGLPVLQWQYPVNAEVAVVGGTQYYGYVPTSTVTGVTASQLAAELPNGPTYQVTGGNQAGDTDQIVVTGNPVDYGFNIEYVNGTVNLVPAPLDIVANSIVVPSGQPIPPYSATYTGLVNGDTPSDLNGTLVFTVSPQPDSAIGLHTITPSGQSSSNYAISYFSGLLDVTTVNPIPSQIAATFTAEIASIQNQFANNPTNGLDPFFFTIFPSQFGLGGELFGALNHEPDSTDYAYASSTSNLPASSRLATPDTGVVEIIDGVVVIGDPQTGKPIFIDQPGTPLSQAVLDGLRGVLSPSVYNELLALIHGG